MFKKITKFVVDSDNLEFLINTLILRVKDNLAVSTNPMIDGMNIAWMLKNKRFLADMMFTNHDMGHILDGTIQQLEQNIIWILNNEDTLCDIYNEAVKSLIKKHFSAS